MLIILLSVALTITVIALFVTIVAMRSQQNKEFDNGLNQTFARHPILANPGFIVYVLFPVAVFIGAAIWMYYRD
jgi:nitrogen fixation-related uncharacterized protein